MNSASQHATLSRTKRGETPPTEESSRNAPQRRGRAQLLPKSTATPQKPARLPVTSSRDLKRLKPATTTVQTEETNVEEAIVGARANDVEGDADNDDDADGAAVANDDNDDDADDDADVELWTVYSARVSLSAVLNDPSLWRRESDLFTRTWGEAFLPAPKPSLSTLPQIRKSEFAHYSRQLAKPYRMHVRRMRHGSSSSSSPTRRAAPDRRHPSDHLDVVPKIFKTSDFCLEDPNTFRQIFSESTAQNLVSSSPARADVGTNSQTTRLLQEKLTHYLDIVEIQLAQQIALKSEDFFHTISSQDTLTEEMVKLRHLIKDLRFKLSNIDSEVTRNPFLVLQLKRRRSRYVAIYHKLKLMATVHQTQPTIQLLLTTSDFVGALDLIATTQEVLVQELAGVQSFRHLGSQLIEMERLIGKVTEADFVKITKRYLVQPTTGDNLDCDEEDKIVSAVFGLLKLKKHHFLDSYRGEAFSIIKFCIKQTSRRLVLGAEKEEESVSNLVELMRKLSFDEWLGMIQTVFEAILVILRRLKVVHKLIESVVSQLIERVDEEEEAENEEETAAAAAAEDEEEKDTTTTSPSPQPESVSYDGAVSLDELDISASVKQPSPPPPPPPPSSQQSELTFRDAGILTRVDGSKVVGESRELLCSACELAHVRCTKLIGVKSRDGSLEKLIGSDFVSMVRIFERFIVECERICGKQIFSLRATILTQTKKYLEKFHEERKAKLCMLLESEHWKPVDSPSEIQCLIVKLENGVNDQAPVSQPSQPKRRLVVKDQEFTVVSALLLLLKIVYEYCQSVKDMPMLVTDIMNRLTEILQIFNRKTYQLVLEAGAFQTVGLKSITAKHLAAASQSLLAVAAVVPIVRGYFDTRLLQREKVLLNHFDSLVQSFTNHSQEIHSKLISMIDEVISRQLSKWEIGGPTPSLSVQNIVRQIVRLHDALHGLVSRQQLKTVCYDILAVFKTRLKQRIQKISAEEDSFVIEELAAIVARLQDLNGFKELVKNVSNLWAGR